MKCRCGCSPSWVCWGGTDVSNKPRRATKLTLYPSPVLSEKANMNIKPHRTCFAMPFCVCHLDIQLEKNQKMVWGCRAGLPHYGEEVGMGPAQGSFTGSTIRQAMVSSNSGHQAYSSSWFPGERKQVTHCYLHSNRP